jgi:hypothetical protein
MLVAKPHGGCSGEACEFDDARVAHVELDDGAVLTGAKFAEDA